MNGIRRFLRASGVGLVASAVDLAVLAALVEWAHVSPQAANVPALLCGAAVQFVGARHVVFRARAGALGGQLARFALAELGTLTLNALLFAAITRWTPLPFPLARLASTSLVFAGFSFPTWAGIFRSDAARA